tara:strand:- start:858 stop:1064 length:207 start_codon:yes stop_codon:yes gene_type:complete
MLLDFLIVLFAAIAILTAFDLAVFVGVFVATGFRFPTRQEYFTNAPAIALGLLGGVAVYCLTVIVFLL